MPRMKEDWFERFLEALQADPRGMRQISLDAGCGVNYVQQLVTNKKEPTVGRFVRVLDTLGAATALYVITGLRVTSEDEGFLRLALRLDSKSRADLASFLAALEGRAKT